MNKVKFEKYLRVDWSMAQKMQIQTCIANWDDMNIIRIMYCNYIEYVYGSILR